MINPNVLSTSKTGVIMHGRHLESVGWEDMMWGHPTQEQLGTTPTAVLSMLDEGPEKIAVVTMGTGASRLPDGTFEAEMTQFFLLDKFAQLDTFSAIAGHPLWNRTTQRVVRSLVENAILDTTSQNTNQEVDAAAKLFSQRGVNKVLEVTGASHAPRCQSVQSQARDAGIIPRHQRWHLIADDIPYPGTKVGDTLIVEAPHRGDDPARNLPEGLSAPATLRQWFQVPPHEQAAFLEGVSQLANDLKK